MKKHMLFIGFMIIALTGTPQDYQIDFATSSLAPLDSVHVENLNQQTALTLKGPDTLHLINNGTGIMGKQNEISHLKAFPNPLEGGKGTLRFFQPVPGTMKIEMYNINGRRIVWQSVFLEKGEHAFQIEGIPSGFFVVHLSNAFVSQSVKLISIDGNPGTPGISYIHKIPGKTTGTGVPSIKSVKNVFVMHYKDRDTLKLTGYSDSLVSLQTFSPASSQTVVFSFNTFYPAGSIHCIPGGSIISDVTNPATGETWMDRNLGALRVAQTRTDFQAYGDLYQWGRLSDGHQCRNSGTTGLQSSSDAPGHGSFIIKNDDWRFPKNDSLWQGVNGTNNPCPEGYRLPTENEWHAERLSWSVNNSIGAFDSPLKLPLGGARNDGNGLLHYPGSTGYYYSSTADGFMVHYLCFSNTIADTFSSPIRAVGMSVRCIKD